MTQEERSMEQIVQNTAAMLAHLEAIREALFVMLDVQSIMLLQASEDKQEFTANLDFLAKAIDPLSKKFRPCRPPPK